MQVTRRILISLQAMTQMEFGHWACALAVIGLIVPARAHTIQHPIKTPPTQIGVRNGHAMVYEGISDRVLLFGGADDAKVCEDTWEWDGRTWQQVSTTGPGPRTFPSMAYDSIRRKVLLFGGNRVLFGSNEAANRFLNDTWQWDGRRWTELKVPGPPARAEAAMAFDKERGRVVLFGGYYRSSGRIIRLGDTWEWDGYRWVQSKVSGPNARNGAAVTYDASRGKLILFGGRTEDGVSGETWEWNGGRWEENRSALTEGRFNPVMAYDSARQKVIRFGGRYAGKPVGDTWEYDGKSWIRLSSVGPAARNHTAMAYNPKIDRIILFGGHDFGTTDAVNVFGDTWEWHANEWLQKDAGAIRKRIENGH